MNKLTRSIFISNNWNSILFACLLSFLCCVVWFSLVQFLFLSAQYLPFWNWFVVSINQHSSHTLLIFFFSFLFFPFFFFYLFCFTLFYFINLIRQDIYHTQSFDAATISMSLADSCFFLFLFCSKNQRRVFKLRNLVQLFTKKKKNK